MSKIQWEHDLAERPFREQLRAMGWQWIVGDTEGVSRVWAANRLTTPSDYLIILFSDLGQEVTKS